MSTARVIAIATVLFDLIVVGADRLMAHGEAGQPIDTTSLEPLGKDVRAENPYRGNAKAIEIGARAYNSNCARCHGLDAKSGGMAPDLRALEPSAVGDAWFIMRVRGGATRNGVVKMPPFESVLSQEAMWAIKSYVDAQPDDK